MVSEPILLSPSQNESGSLLKSVGLGLSRSSGWLRSELSTQVDSDRLESASSVQAAWVSSSRCCGSGWLAGGVVSESKADSTQ